MNKVFLVALFVVLVFIFVRWQASKYNEFLEDADTVQGVILSKEERSMRNDQPQRKQYIVSYSYRVDDKEYIGTDNFEFTEMWSELKEGQTVDISYLKTDPAKSQLSMLLKNRAKAGSSR